MLKMLISAKSLKIFVIFLIGCSIFGYCVWLNFAWSNIETVQAKSLNEYIFHGVLLKMHIAFLAGDIRMFFSYAFYSYGFIFFLLNYLAVIPFITDSFNPMMLIAPRLISSFFMVFSLIFLDATLKNLAATNFERACCILFLILMPGVWFSATWFHPDFMMTGFLMLSIYYLSNDISPESPSFNKAIIFWAIAIAVKIQAISMAPLYLWLFIFRKDMLHLSSENILLLCKFFLQIAFIYVALNPYLLHPDGINAWLASQLSEASKMAPEDSSALISVGERLRYSVLDFYFPLLTYLVFIFLALRVFAQDLKNKTPSFYGALCITFLMNITFLLFFMNKGWNHYYLPVAFIASLILILSLKHSFPNKNYKFIAMLCILGLQSYSFIPAIKTTFIQRSNDQIMSRDSLYRYSDRLHSSKEMKLQNETLFNMLQYRVSENTKILSHAYIGFPFSQLDMSYDQVTIIQQKLTVKDIDTFVSTNNLLSYMLFRKETIDGIKNTYIDELIIGRDDLIVLDDTDKFLLVGLAKTAIQ